MSEQQDVAAGAGAVVVGVDGSESARTAVAAALREADRRDRPVVAVMAYDAPDLWMMEIGGQSLDRRELQRQVEVVARSVVDDVIRGVREEGVEIPEVRVLAGPGSPAEVLCRVAQEAELLVVGHRGRGGLASRLIGSVGLGVVVHAACPVLVVRPTPPVSAGRPG